MSGKKTSAMDVRMRAVLVDPKRKEPLRLNASGSELISQKTGLAYPVRHGIPILVAQEARKLDTGET